MQRNAIIGGAMAGIIAGLGAVYWITRDERKPEAPPAEVSEDSADSAGGAFSRTAICSRNCAISSSSRVAEFPAVVANARRPHRPIR